MIRENSNLARFLRVNFKQMRKRYDIFCVIDGAEGIGKSRGAFLNIADYWFRVLLKKRLIPRSAINVDIKDFVKALETSEPFSFIGLDEAGDSMDSMEFANKFNRLIYQAYTIIREKILFTIIVLPSFFDLSPRFRKRRVRYLIHVYKRIDNRCKNKKCNTMFVGSECPDCGSKLFRKGFVCYEIYDRQRLGMILERNMYKHIKRIRCGVPPLFRGTISEYKGNISEYYSGLKTKKMTDVLKKLKGSLTAFTGEKKCKHEWRYLRKSGMYYCRKCGFERSTNPFGGGKED